MSVPSVFIPDDAAAAANKRLGVVPACAPLRRVFLGRIRPKARPQCLRLASYLKADAAAPPASVDYGGKAAASIARMYLNDTYGDCVIAGKAHELGVWSANDADSAGRRAARAGPGDANARWPRDEGCAQAPCTRQAGGEADREAEACSAAIRGGRRRPGQDTCRRRANGRPRTRCGERESAGDRLPVPRVSRKHRASDCAQLQAAGRCGFEGGSQLPDPSGRLGIRVAVVVEVWAIRV